MWDCLVNFSKCVEDNSGQIQIVIALVALILAILGYFKVKHQIKMAENASRDAEEQTKQYAKQVGEAAKQTQLAAKQFENSNIQIQELINNRDLMLKIHNRELKSKCVELCIKAIEENQTTMNALKRAKKSLEKIKPKLNLIAEKETVFNDNFENMTKDISECERNIDELIIMSANLSENESDLSDEILQEKLFNITLVYLEALKFRHILVYLEAELKADLLTD